MSVGEGWEFTGRKSDQDSWWQRRCYQEFGQAILMKQETKHGYVG
jgi:hypothetical protein